MKRGNGRESQVLTTQYIRALQECFNFWYDTAISSQRKARRKVLALPVYPELNHNWNTSCRLCWRLYNESATM